MACRLCHGSRLAMRFLAGNFDVVWSWAIDPGDLISRAANFDASLATHLSKFGSFN
ncbi:hypothetical protein OAG56_05975 [Mariniblastus sp.]|nr:hypothetical protein [Mariniblastus sp.]MDB4756903.1 hypothetical protein [Mariniblastus sp.]